MFDVLSGKLSEVFDRLRRRGALSEADVAEALREIRLALLDADVALPVVKDFIAAVRETRWWPPWVAPRCRSICWPPRRSPF